MTRFLPQDIRNDFPILDRRINDRRLVYFDNAATTHKPRQVINTIKHYYERFNSNIHRSPHTLGREVTELYWNAHANIARFIGSEGAEEIIFVRNCTEGINLVAYAFLCGSNPRLSFAEGDEVVLTVMEHHSNIVPWQMVRDQRGITLKFVDIHEDGTLNIEHMRKAVTKRTKLVCCAHVSNVLGTHNPAREIGQIAHDVGALFLLDGAQSVPHLRVDVRDIDCDFLAFSGHKMLGPMGSGVLFGKKHLLEEMAPFQYGGDMISDVSTGKASWNDLPWKFEAGTANIGGGIALGGATGAGGVNSLTGATDYLSSLGMEAIQAHELALTKRLLEGLTAVPGVRIYGLAEARDRCGIVAFNIDKHGELVDGHIIAQMLDDVGIAVRAGGHCAYPLIKRLGIPGVIRVSFYIYNTAAEVDYFLEQIDDIVRCKLL